MRRSATGSSGRPATLGEGVMMENLLGGIVSLGVLIYLLWALLEPERF
jgi:K+-transporting ATPase KdpF subunit